MLSIPPSFLSHAFKELSPLFDLYKKHGYELRLVGGCVRDALLGKVASDIDLATPLPPEQGLELLQSHGIECVPTGLKYGTITALINKKPYEITTLRQDVKTDGRWPEVSYSDDWQKDAMRRDLTINALYADFNGNIYDYFNGIQDLEKGIIRFIGKAENRIKEDYLRILRLFRFHAWYGKVPIDDDTLTICARLAPHLKSLSNERITKEILRLLEALDPSVSLIQMDQAKVLSILFQRYSLDALLNLLELEKSLGHAPLPLLRLAALTDDYNHLRLSNAQLQWIQKVRTLSKEDLLNEDTYRFLLSLEHIEIMTAALVMKGIQDQLLSKEIQKGILAFKGLAIPPFPINGEDLLAMGISGIAIGKLLHECRLWWASQKYLPTKEECLSWLHQQKA